MTLTKNPPVQTPPEQGQASRFTSSLRRRPAAKKILLIEDHPTLREKLASNLRKNGYEVTPAADGVQGLLEFVREVPDLVILDLQLPGMYGLRLLAEIRERSPSIPVVLMTNKMAPVFSAIKSVTILRKPFLPEWLLSHIEKAMTGQRSLRRRRTDRLR